MANGTRTERDSMGEMEVPADALYGAQTRRAQLNFPISGWAVPASLIAAMGEVKAAAARANQGLGLLHPSELAQAIEAAAREVAAGRHDDQFVVDVFQTGSGTSTNMNANEVIASLANERLTGRRGGKSPVHPNDHVNMCQSSNDVFPTAIHVAAARGIEGELLPAFRRLQDALSRVAGRTDGVMKIGRTHLMDAVPIRLGQEVSGWARQVELSARRVARAAGSMEEIPLGGTAVGTGLNSHPDFAGRAAGELSRATGLAFRPAANPFEALSARDAAVEVSGALRAAAVGLSVVANDIRWLASGPRCGIGEIAIPELQPGSSIMPGKVNPVIPEAVMMVGAQVVGQDATVAWAAAMGSSFQLNTMMPVIAFALLNSIRLLASAARVLADRCVEATDDVIVFGYTRGIEAREARCRETVERSLAMVTALAPRLGYDIAAAIAKKASESGLNIRDVLEELVGLDSAAIAARLGIEPVSGDEASGPLTADEVNALLDPRGQTIPGAEMSGSGG